MTLKKPDVLSHLDTIDSQLADIPNQTYITEKVKTVDMNNALALKADKTSLDVTNANIASNTSDIVTNTNNIANNTSAIASLASGSPKGIYADLSAITTAFPTGNGNIYLTTDGKWNYWNGSAWTAGGTYQSTGIADGTVTKKSLNFLALMAVQSKNLFNKLTVTAGKYVSYSTGNLTSGATYNASDYIPILPSTNYSIQGTNQQIAFYDSSKVYISGLSAVNTPSFVPITTPSNAAYIRITVKDAELATVQLEVGNLQTYYIDYANQLNNNSILANSIGQDKLSFIPITAINSKNLFNKNAIISGKYINYNTGILITNANYSVSDYIPVLANTSYAVSGTTQQLAFFDSSKTFISGLITTGTYFTIPSNAVYIRLSMMNTEVDKVQLELGTVATTFDSFGIKLSNASFSPENISYIQQNMIDITPIIKTVKTSGGDFTTIPLALASIADASKNKPYEIVVYPGIYTDMNWDMKDYVNIRGTNRDTCIIKGELPVTASDADITAQSTFNWNTIGKISNLTITGRNCRYPIHTDDSNARDDLIQEVDNCYIEYFGNQDVIDYRIANSLDYSGVWQYGHAWGSGMSSGQINKIKNTTFKAPKSTFYFHNNINFIKPSKTIIEGCKCIATDVNANAIQIDIYNSGHDDLFVMKGNKITGNFLYNDLSTTDCKGVKVFGYGNSTFTYNKNNSTYELELTDI